LQVKEGFFSIYFESITSFKAFKNTVGWVTVLSGATEKFETLATKNIN